MSETNQPARVGGGGAAWLLWLSAGVLAALVALELASLSPRGPGPESVDGPAPVRLGDVASASSDYAVLSVDQGGNDDIVVVVDQRSESLLVYSVVNQRSVELRAREDLSDLFNRARGGAGGRPAR